MTEQPHASEDEAREFARVFHSFIHWVHRSGDDERRRSPVTDLITERLGDAATRESVVSRQLPDFEHVNLQTAIDAWASASGREVDVQGLRNPMHHQRPDLESLVAGDDMTPVRLGSPAFVDLPNGPDSTLACLRLALLLVHDARGAYVVLVSGPAEHENGINLEVAGLPVTEAQAVLAELDDLRRRLNVYRGHLVDVSVSEMGGVTLTFAATPRTGRGDLVLPEDVLARVERHALDVARHRDALLARGQHLKRGLLLYGPPGTGKTLTTGYLLAAMAGYTRFRLAGQALQAVGSLAALARELEPAVVVLEDVDLVAEDRDFDEGSSSVLFELLDAMDGAAADADILFLLTTNRADLLEPALASRPGRVDVAVEIALPDADARRQLFALYGRTVATELSDDDVAEIVERTDGVTASFVKELWRRAVLESLLDADGPRDTVTATHVGRALDDLLDSAQEVTRTLLGVGVDPTDGPPMRRPRSGVAFGGRPAYGSTLHIEYDDED